MNTVKYAQAILEAHRVTMREIPHSVLVGQGVGDPTGIFSTTIGLAEEFGRARVIDTPIMEEGMMGICIGLALNGIYPIQTHIRVDFLLLAMNQLVNSAAKYRYMYGNRFEVPMLVRAVIGRSWGQGPQHSQALHSMLGHIPGLTVIMPATAGRAYHGYLHSARNYRNPVVSIEHRFLYDYDYHSVDTNLQDDPFGCARVREGEHLTIVAVSFMVQEALSAAEWVAEHCGISCEVIDLNCVSHPDHQAIFDSVSKTGHLIVADVGWSGYGLSAEVARGIVERGPQVLRAPMRTLGTRATPCPTSHALEETFYDDASDIIAAIYALIGTRSGPLLTKADCKSRRKQFKGPF